MPLDFPNNLLTGGNVACPTPQTKTKAFQDAGATLKAYRGHWSLDTGERVIVTLWDVQVRRDVEGNLIVDLNFEHPQFDPIRQHPPDPAKHKQRAEHLSLARTEQRRLSVVIIFGALQNGKV